MKKWEIDRRTVLRIGGMTFALPLLEAMLPSLARALGESDPKRYICMYIASGTYLKKNNGANWYPGQAGPLDPNNLPVVFQPFAQNARDFSIIRGLENRARYECRGTGGDHSTAVASYLTAAPYSDGGSNNCTVPGSSFDRAIAARNNWKAYALSASGYDGYHPDLTPFDYGRTVSYDNGRQAECWLNPYKLFFNSGLFTGVPAAQQTSIAASAPGTPALARNKSILDNAYQSINNLKSKVGTADKQRIEDYFSGLREVERTLAEAYPSPTPTPLPTATPQPTPQPTATPFPTATPTPGPNPTATPRPTATPQPTPTPTPAPTPTPQPTPTPGSNQCYIQNPPPSSLNNEDHDGNRMDFGARLKAFCDIMILAFKCNRAQVFSLMFEYENTNRKFLGQIPSYLVYRNANVGQPGSHNEIAHWGDGGPGEETERMNRCITRDRYYMSFVAYLIGMLKAANDPSGSPILDNTIIQFGHGLWDGNHGTDGMKTTTGLPTVIAGGRNIITPGNFYAHEGVDIRDLYYSINSYMRAGLADFRGSTKLIKL